MAALPSRGEEVPVAGRHSLGLVAHEGVDDALVHAGTREARRETVPEHMQPLHDLPLGPPHGRLEPSAGLVGFERLPVVADDGELAARMGGEPALHDGHQVRVQVHPPGRLAALLPLLLADHDLARIEAEVIDPRPQDLRPPGARVGRDRDHRPRTSVRVGLATAPRERPDVVQ